MASIVRRNLSTGQAAYLVRYRTLDGAQRSKQFARRRDADRFVASVESARNAGSLVDPRLGRITVDEWWQRWWPTVTNLRPSTRARDEIYYRRHIAPALGTTPLSRLDRTSLRQWVATLVDPSGSDLAPATARKVVQILNKLVRAALEDRLIVANPVDRLPLPKVEREEMRFVSHDELHRLADSIDTRYRALVLLGGYGGLRLGELLGLRWSRVDLLRRTVTVSEILVDVNNVISFGPPNTKASRRVITLPRSVCDELARVRSSESGPDDLVFRSPDGKPIRASLFRARFWTPAVKAADLAPLRIHDLRHTAVSLWIAAGANPKQVAVRAGHTSVAVVFDRYGHLYPQHDDELIEQLESHARRAAS